MAYSFIYRLVDSYGQGGALSQSEVDNNMHAVYDRMAGYGFTLQAVCGMLGCFHEESNVNPGSYENSHGGSLSTLPYFAGGLGMAQWTDYPAYTLQYPNPLPWSADREGRDWYDGDFQCWLLTKADDASYTSMGYGQGPRWGWLTDASWGADVMSWSQYQNYIGSLAQATRTWFFCFEWHGTEQDAYDRLGPNCITDRINWANYAYDLLRGYDPDPPGPGPGPGPGPTPGPLGERSNFFLMLKPLYKYRKNRRK